MYFSSPEASWKQNRHGGPSTSGTKASVCFIMKNWMFLANVGDLTMVLGRMLQKHIHLPNPCAGNSHVTRLQAREHSKKGED